MQTRILSALIVVIALISGRWVDAVQTSPPSILVLPFWQSGRQAAAGERWLPELPFQTSLETLDWLKVGTWISLRTAFERLRDVDVYNVLLPELAQLEADLRRDFVTSLGDGDQLCGLRDSVRWNDLAAVKYARARRTDQVWFGAFTGAIDRVRVTFVAFDLRANAVAACRTVEQPLAQLELNLAESVMSAIVASKASSDADQAALRPEVASPESWKDYAEAMFSGHAAQVVGTDTAAGRAIVAHGVAAARRAVKRDPDYAAAWSTLGWRLSLIGEFTDAVAAFRESVARAPSSSALRGLGRALARLRRPAEAVPHYRAALALRPAQEIVAADLLAALQQAQQHEEALELARSLINSREPDRRRAALNVIARHGSVADHDRLDRLHEDEDEGMRRRMAQLRQVIADKRRGPAEPVLAVSPRLNGLLRLSFSSAGAIFTSVTEHNTLGVWQTESGRLLRELPLAGQVAMSPKGDVVAVNEANPYGVGHPEYNNTITLWDTATGHLLDVLDVAADAKSLEFSRDGRLLAIADRRSGIRVFDLTTGLQLAAIERRQVFELAGISPPSDESRSNERTMDLSVTLSATSEELLVYGWVGGQSVIALWDLQAERVRWTRQLAVRQARFSPAGGVVATVDARGISVFNVGSGEVVWSTATLSPESGHVYLRFTQDGGKLVAWNWTTERAWQSGTGAETAVPDGPFAETGAEFGVTGLTADFERARVLTPDGRRWLIHDREQGRARLVDRASSQNLWSTQAIAAFPVAIAMRRDRTIEVIGTTGSGLASWMWQHGSGSATAPTTIDDVAYGAWGEKCEGLSAMALSDDHASLAFAMGPCVRTYALQPRRQLAAFRFGQDVKAMAISPDATRVAIALDDEPTDAGGSDRSISKKAIQARIAIRRLADGRQIRSFLAHPDRIIDTVAFSPDGRYLVSASFSEVELFDLESGRRMQRFDDLEAPAIFDRTGTRLITGPGVNVSDVSGLLTARRPTRNDAGRFPSLPASSMTAEASICPTVGASFSLSQAGNLLSISCPEDIGEPVRVWDLESNRLVGSLVDEHLKWGLGRDAVFSDDDEFLISQTGSGMSIWRNPRRSGETSARPLCALWSFSDNSWVVVDAEGRFDSDRLDGSETVSWVMPDDPFTAAPLELFLREYYEPRLLPKRLAGVQLRAVPDVLTLNRVQPHVRILKIAPTAHDPSKVSVTVEVAARSATFRSDGRDVVRSTGAHDLHLFRGGQLVARAPGDDGVIALDATSKTAQVTFHDVQLPRHADARTVEFSAYAFNDDRIKSGTSRLTYTMPDDVPARLGRAYVIAVGVDAYANASANLQFAVNDASVVTADVARRLETTFAQVTRVVLTAPAPATAGSVSVPATKKHLEAVLGRLGGKGGDPALLREVTGGIDLAPAQPEDFVLLYVASHGYSDNSGDFFMFLSDSDPTDSSRPALARAVSSRELSDWLGAVDAGELVLIVDACHGAAAVESLGFKPGPMGSAGLGQLAYNKGMRVLTATQASDVALESERLKHGLLTFALVEEGLRRGGADAAPRDGNIMLGEWLRFGETRVPALHGALASGRFTSSSASRGLQLIGPLAVSAVPLQQPKLFDYARSRNGVLLAKSSSTRSRSSARSNRGQMDRGHHPSPD